MKVLFGIAVVLAAFVIIGGMVSLSGGTSSANSQPNPQAASGSASDQTSAFCTASDFSVTKLRAYTEYDYAKLTGIVTSHCKYAAGVQLKWTAFNSDGSVAFSDDFWPASTTNIAPGTEYPFEMMNTAPQGNWTYTVQPISLSVW